MNLELTLSFYELLGFLIPMLDREAMVEAIWAVWPHQNISFTSRDLAPIPRFTFRHIRIQAQTHRAAIRRPRVLRRFARAAD